MVEVEIRPAESGDREAVARCTDAAYAKYVPRIGKKPGPMLAGYDGLIADGRVWVAVDGGAVRGVLVLQPEAERMVVWSVAVDPAGQGRRLGRRLMAFAEERAVTLGVPETYLWTNELMTENVAWYRRLGYQEVERRTEGGYGRVFMRKPLGPR